MPSSLSKKLVSLLALAAMMASASPTPGNTGVDVSLPVPMDGGDYDNAVDSLIVPDWRNADNEKASNGTTIDLDGSRVAHTLTCDNFKNVPVKRIKEGIKYLRKITSHRPHLNANSCERVSCSWDTAIWWCNSDNKYRELPGYYNIAQGAQVIVDNCMRDWIGQISGTLDHPDHWRVEVKYDDNKC
ncbi:hypothetical protein BJX99DRAFT_252764 [Aspergillus californicus]